MKTTALIALTSDNTPPAIAKLYSILLQRQPNVQATHVVLCSISDDKKHVLPFRCPTASRSAGTAATQLQLDSKSLAYVMIIAGAAKMSFGCRQKKERKHQPESRDCTVGQIGVVDGDTRNRCVCCIQKVDKQELEFALVLTCQAVHN